MLESSAPRVVVLGRSGDAQQQLQHALDAIGAQTLASGELDQLDPQQMRDAHPDVVLVSVDDRTDDASLDRWQIVFDVPGTTVVFDDAEVTRHLSGWDLARWARHLAAKVLGRADVLLPPVHAYAERLPETIQLDISTLDLSLPADTALADDDFPATPILTDVGASDALTLDLNVDDNIDPLENLSDSTELDLGENDVAQEQGESIDFDMLSSQFEAEQQRTAREVSNHDVAPTLDELLQRQSVELDVPGMGSNSSRLPDAAVSQKPTPEPPAPDHSRAGPLELSPLDASFSTQKSAVSTAPAMDLSSYSLEPLTVESVTSPADSGSIAIVAGLGGPDAVRQVLAGLPKTLPVPVLLWQHLDAGKHDRLAQQLGKASALPVYLAAQDGLARTGAVAVMTPGLGVRTDAEGCWFQALDGGVAEAVDTALSQPASLLMVLSGADGSVVAIAAAHAASGSKVYVQSPDTCFDGTAAAALMARGMAATSAAELALLAAAHWSSPESPKPEIRAGKRPK